jgi:pilus assembly protein CpaD
MNVSVPDGPGSSDAIQYFGERLAAEGVPRARIMVGTHQGVAGHVELGYIAYTAKADECGDWSENAGDMLSNEPMPNFGCSVQHNLAAQIENPQDLIQPRALVAGDAVRRNGVMGHYQKGEVTQADKHTGDKSVEQSGTASTIQ